MTTAAENFRGAIYMMVSMAAFILNDTIVKILSSDLPMFQLIFMRGVAASVLLGMLAIYNGKSVPRVSKHDFSKVCLRTAAEVGATFCYLTALFKMPIANATAILQSAPLAITFGAALVLGETVGWRRYLAIAIGFAGVLLIVKPGTDGFDAYALWALLAVVFIAIRDLTTRKLSANIPSILVAFFTSTSVMALAGIISLSEPWVEYSDREVYYLIFAAGFIVVGYIAAVTAMRHGDVAVVSPFRYSILVWAILIDLSIFNFKPDFWTIIGSIIVVGVGIFMFYREMQVTKRKLAGKHKS